MVIGFSKPWSIINLATDLADPSDDDREPSFESIRAHNQPQSQSHTKSTRNHQNSVN